MTRKDYVLIADIIRDLREDFDNGGSDEISLSLVADALADALATDNPRFNRERFISATRATSSHREAISRLLAKGKVRA